MGLKIQDIVLISVVDNILEPINLLKNFFKEFYFIISDCIAEFANDYFEDYYSFSYYLGDLIYRILVADNSEIEFLFPTYNATANAEMVNG